MPIMLPSRDNIKFSMTSYKVTLKCVRVTAVAMEKQYM